MTDTLFLEEKRKYEKMWSIDPYRSNSPGYNGAGHFLDFFKDKRMPLDSIIDFGCGTGVTALPFLEAKLKVSLVDIAENCLNDNIKALTHLFPETVTFCTSPLWKLPSSLEASDWIYCTDVLEHIPPEKIDATLKEMAKKTKKGGLLQVFLLDEDMGKCVGEKLHLTIKPLDWWLDKIASYWSIEKVYSVIPEVRYCIYVGPPI